jgi:hypothetical protein
MDPNANLEEQRRLVKFFLDDGESTNPTAVALHAVRLAELARALDEWIKGGGFLPSDWRVWGDGRHPK